MSKKTACGKCDTCPCSSTQPQSSQQEPFHQDTPQQRQPGQQQRQSLQQPHSVPQLPPCACGTGGNVPPLQLQPQLMQQQPQPNTQQPILQQAPPMINQGNYSCARQPPQPQFQPQPIQQYTPGSRCTCGAKSKVQCSCGAYSVPLQPQYAQMAQPMAQPVAQSMGQPMGQPMQLFEYVNCNSSPHAKRGTGNCEHCRRKKKCCTII